MKRKKQTRISVVIPTFNEKDNIVPLIQEVKKLHKLKDLNTEIIVVDDNSPDKTGEVVSKIFVKDKNVRVYIRKKEKGLGTAILYGIRWAKGDVIIGMDADFNHPPEKIPELVDKLKKADLVIASRFIKGGGMEHKVRYWLAYIYNLFLNKVLGFPVLDNMSGFYAISKKKLQTLPLEYIYRGYGEYHLRLVYLAKAHGFRIVEIPAYYPKRTHGKSKSNLLRMFFEYLYVAVGLVLGDEAIN